MQHGGPTPCALIIVFRAENTLEQIDQERFAFTSALHGTLHDKGGGAGDVCRHGRHLQHPGHADGQGILGAGVEGKAAARQVLAREETQLRHQEGRQVQLRDGRAGEEN